MRFWFFNVRCHESNQPISPSHTKTTAWAISDELFDGINETENVRNKQQYLRRRHFRNRWTHGCIRKENMKAPTIYRTLCAITTDLGSSAGNNTPKQPSHTKLCTVFTWDKRQPTCIQQTMYWIIREYLFVYIFASNYYSHTSSNSNRGGWVGYGRQCMFRR